MVIKINFDSQYQVFFSNKIFNFMAVYLAIFLYSFNLMKVYLNILIVMI